MSSQLLVPIGWLVHIITCHYFVRRIHANLTRTILTLMPCLLLTYIGCHDLPQDQMTSVIIVSMYWIMSLRIIQSIVFSPNENPPFYSFVLKLFWTAFPVIPSAKTEKQWHIILDFISGIVKLLINHWIVRWLIRCEPSENYARMIMLCIMVLTSPYIADIQMGIVRLVTQDKYTLLSISNYPLFSKSIREFWGRRYNRLTSTVFKECIFQPVRSCLSSPVIAALSTFIISGLLHVHIIVAAFNDTRAIVPTLAFFFLHGIACCIETHWAIRLPAPLGWLMTHSFLLITLPLYMRPYTRLGPAFFDQNPPPLFASEWIPKLPVPNTCLL